jgi:hypothetical protein
MSFGTVPHIMRLLAFSFFLSFTLRGTLVLFHPKPDGHLGVDNTNKAPKIRFVIPNTSGTFKPAIFFSLGTDTGNFFC